MLDIITPGELPADILLVRHFQSDGNLAWRASKEGDNSYFTDEFRRVHTSKWRLTPKGREQAPLTGEWIRRNVMHIADPKDFNYAAYPGDSDIYESSDGQFYFPFHRMMTSEYVRAQESAGLLDLPGNSRGWYLNPYLREREYGALDGLTYEQRMELNVAGKNPLSVDAFFGIPPSGESIAQLCLRIKDVINTVVRKCPRGRVIFVCHGEVMWAFRIVLERMTSERFVELDSSKDPYDRIHNGQVLWYSRRERSSDGIPTGRLSDHLDWKLSVCPNRPELASDVWERVNRPTFTNAELLASAARHPRYFDAATAAFVSEDAG